MISAYLVGIDPGTHESAYVVTDEKLKPVEFRIVSNNELISTLKSSTMRYLAIEMMESFGQKVGSEVFETLVWIGRFWESADNCIQKRLIKRKKDICMNLCGNRRADDVQIIHSLINRFAASPRNHGKGSRYKPDWFYGFKANIWQAYATAVTAYDLYFSKES